MKILIQNRHPRKKINKKTVVKVMSKLLRLIKKPQGEVSLVFATNIYIKKLNKKYLGINKPTDVLSFPMYEDTLLGDIVISLDEATKNAKKRGVKIMDEIKMLLTHGILHLVEEDHSTLRQFKKMKLKEFELLKEVINI